MNICIKRSERGFTIVEMMVVISIVVILLSILFASIAQARQGSRDKKRISDLANIEFALTLEKERNRDYPNSIAYDAGVEIGLSTTGINAIIRAGGGNLYIDPSSSGTGGVYGYWYDSDFTCIAPNQVVLYVKTMERSGSSNFASVCTAASAADLAMLANGYIVILD